MHIHGGNQGSNPRSGTSRSPPPEAGFVVLWGGFRSRKMHRTGRRVYTARRQGPVATARVGGYPRQRDPRGHGEGPRTVPACSRRRDPSTPKGAVYAWTKVARGADRGGLDL